LLSGIKSLEKLVDFSFGWYDFFHIRGFESELRIELMKLWTLLKFGWCGYFGDTGVLIEIIVMKLESFALIKFVNDKIFAHMV